MVVDDFSASVAEKVGERHPGDVNAAGGLIHNLVGSLQGGVPPLGNLIIIAIASLMQTAIYVIMFALIIRAILSWVAPQTYNYMTSLLASITEPLLTPIRRRMPATGGIDFSMLVLIIILQLVLMLAIQPLMDLGVGRLI